MRLWIIAIPLLLVGCSAERMTKAESAACAGQKALNTLTSYLDARGRKDAAKYASWGSYAAGVGCEWRE